MANISKLCVCVNCHRNWTNRSQTYRCKADTSRQGKGAPLSDILEKIGSQTGRSAVVSMPGESGTVAVGGLSWSGGGGGEGRPKK